MKKTLFATLVFVWPLLTFSQNLIYVSSEGMGLGTPGDPASLNDAINMALNNDSEDIVYLQQGNYLNTSITIDYNNPDLDNENITLSGGWNNDYTENSSDPLLTVLDGASERIFTIEAEECLTDRNFGILNLTLTNGTAEDEHGGAIAVFSSASSPGSINLDINRSNFIGNLASVGSGGAIFTQSGITIQNSYFENNSASNGGAIYVGALENNLESTRFISNTIFENNSNFGNQGSTIYNASPNLLIHDSAILGMDDGTSSGNGSAIYGGTNSHTIIDRCRFQDIKILYWGSAVQAWNASMDIANSLFIDCESGLSTGYGAFSYYHGNGDVDREIYISNCSFSGNQSQGGSFGSAIHFRGNGGDAIYVANSIFWDQGLNAMYKESGAAYITHTLSDYDPLGFSIMQPMFNSDPLFEDEFHIGANSPAVDAGNTVYINENWLDFDGGIRLLGEHPDLGAHEYNAPPEGVALPVAELTENNEPGLNFTSISPLGQIGDTHTFELVEGDGSNDADNDKFTIQGEQLLINESANYEEQSTYAIFIRAIDSEGQSAESTLVINVLDANDAPIYVGELEDQDGVVGIFNSFTINMDTFEDEDDGDELSFSATLADNSNLPMWLTFDPESLTFSGIPENEVILEIKVTATDQSGLNASGTFFYDISLLGLKNVEKQTVRIFPNPASDFFSVDIPEFFCNYAIYSMGGKLMDEGAIQGNLKTIDVNDLPPGGYVIIIWDETFTRTGKILIE